MAGGLAGQVLGVALGGTVAATHGWRTAFLAIGAFGLLLAVIYPWLVRESRLEAGASERAKQVKLTGLSPLFAGRTLKCTYVASGLQLFIAAALPAWLPTYFVRYYDLPLQGATSLAALFLAIGGVGMIVCGSISDRFMTGIRRRSLLSASYCLLCALTITAALATGPGKAQLVLLGIGMFLAAASAGAAGAVVAALAPPALHGTAFAVLTLANNAFGLAPGPIMTGWLADRIGLLGALQWAPLASAAAAGIFVLAAGEKRPMVAAVKAA
jgi:MFS family permease